MADTDTAGTIVLSLTYRFVVRWADADGQTKAAAYVSRISASTRATEAASSHGAVPHEGIRAMPGQTAYGELTLERGLIIDPTFEEWASKVWSYPNSGAPGTERLDDLRKDLKIDLHNQAGQAVSTYHVTRCWPSAYLALPDLNPSAGGIAIQSLVLQHEGWTNEGPAAPSDGKRIPDA